MNQEKENRLTLREKLALLFMLAGFVSLIAGITFVFSPAAAAVTGGIILLGAGIVMDWRS